MYLRATLIALLLIFDSLLGILRSIPPFSFIYLFVILLICSAWWFWRIYRKRGLPRTPITLPIILYLIVVVVSTIFSINQRRSLDGLIGTTTVILIFFLFCDLLLSGWDPRTFEIALLIFISYLLIQGMVEIINWFSTWISLTVPEYPFLPLEYRLYGVTAHPNLLAALIYMTIPFVIFRLSRSKSKILITCWIIWLLIADVVFYFTNSRGGLVSISFVLVITIGWLIFQRKKSYSKNLLSWFWCNRNFFGLILVYLGIFGLLYFFSKDNSPISTSLRHGGGITAGRWKFWQIAINNFIQNPILGTGPSTYVISYINQLPSGIYGWIAPHAHNFYINTLSELGVIGFLALGSIILGVIWSYFDYFHFLIRNQKRNLSQDKFVIGTCAAIVGIFVHSLVDQLTWIPHVTIPIIMLLSLGLFATNNIKSGNDFSARWRWVILIIPFIVGSLLMRLNIAKSYQFNSIQSSFDGDWIAATKFLKSAVKLDTNLKFYREQHGYALGVHTSSLENNEIGDDLSEAIQSLEISNDMLPIWAPNYVNLAELYDFAGRPSDSIKTLESINEDWLRVWSFPNLLLANKYESIGKTYEAQNLIRTTLEQNYWASKYAICNNNLLCQEIVPQIPIDSNSDYLLHNSVVSLNNRGKSLQAQIILTNIPAKSSSALTWVDKASTHLLLGENQQAEYALFVAENLDVTKQQSIAAYYALIKATFFIQNNNPQDATRILESIERPIIRPRNYETWVYQSFGFPNHLLPSLAILEKTEYNLKNLQLLENLYLEDNRIEDAKWARNQANLLSKLLEKN